MHMFQCYFLKLCHEQYYLGILLVRNAIQSHWAKNPGVSRIAFQLTEIQRKNPFPSFPCIPWLMASRHPSPTSTALQLSVHHHSIFLTTGGSKYFLCFKVMDIWVAQEVKNLPASMSWVQSIGQKSSPAGIMLYSYSVESHGKRNWVSFSLMESWVRPQLSN